jgi:hypothetical protein
MSFLKSRQWQQEPHILEVLSALSYRTGELSSYLQEIACSLSRLIRVDWSVVTLCYQEGSIKCWLVISTWVRGA